MKNRVLKKKTTHTNGKKGTSSRDYSIILSYYPLCNCYSYLLSKDCEINLIHLKGAVAYRSWWSAPQTDKGVCPCLLEIIFKHLQVPCILVWSCLVCPEMHWFHFGFLKKFVVLHVRKLDGSFSHWNGLQKREKASCVSAIWSNVGRRKTIHTVRMRERKREEWDYSNNNELFLMSHISELWVKDKLKSIIKWWFSTSNECENISRCGTIKCVVALAKSISYDIGLGCQTNKYSNPFIHLYSWFTFVASLLSHANYFVTMSKITSSKWNCNNLFSYFPPDMLPALQCMLAIIVLQLYGNRKLSRL